MKLEYAAHTHPGKQRPHNEDNFFILPEHHLYVVADGMGGHASGEVASLIAVEALANYFIETESETVTEWPLEFDRPHTYDEKRLSTGIRLANRSVYEAAMEEEEYRGMGTTIVAMLLGRSMAYLAHVGDSRAYIVRDGDIEQITEDHSLVNELIKNQQLEPENVERFAHKNVIVRALGLGQDVEVDINRVDPRPGDICLLCSDGLTDLVDAPEILSVIQTGRSDLGAAAQTLAERANDAGGVDNITVLLLSFAE
jgi:protein phosphatase